MEIELRSNFKTLIAELIIRDAEGGIILSSLDSDFAIFSGQEKNDVFPYDANNYHFTLTIPAPLLNCGIYELEFLLTTGPVRIDTKKNIYIEVTDQGSFLNHISKASRGGAIAYPLKWEKRINQ